ncbi:hypothetical protein ROJ8625_00697 [Roseivivax jejudonensis]|uniref:Uncharacterized protein n=1 Tax=Roseivivax jejudonensis TaxID=1529041 RepID=A0A1X6YFV8_9RHOB|nr:hypothetical protein [Roseivivax jejudonensis]SLN19915.1 hypothetical protein ROJ8625_00697 [Roseivivax jejudonensis]
MSRQADRLCAALRDHLAGGSARAPEGSSVLWNCFMTLSRARSCGPVGPNPISHSEIEAWARLMRMPLEPHHVAILTAMDAAYMQHAYRAEDVPQGTKALPRSSGHALSPALFDLAVG